MFQWIWVQHVHDRRLAVLNPKQHRSTPHLVGSKVHVQFQFYFHRHSEMIYTHKNRWKWVIFFIIFATSSMFIVLFDQSAWIYYKICCSIHMPTKLFLKYVSYVLFCEKKILSHCPWNEHIHLQSGRQALWISFMWFCELKIAMFIWIKVEKHSLWINDSKFNQTYFWHSVDFFFFFGCLLRILNNILEWTTIFFE